MVVDYGYSKIYKIWSPLTDKIYVGSTVQTLCNRMAKHRTQYKLWLKGHICPNGQPVGNYSSFRIFEIDMDCEIELLKKFPCNNKKELENEERVMMKLLDNCVNVNKGESLDPEYSKKYYNENKVKKAEYYIENKVKRSEDGKKYYIENKEKINENQKQYYIQNKEKINEKQKTKINCVCGGYYTCANKTQHYKTSKHKKYIDNS